MSRRPSILALRVAPVAILLGLAGCGGESPTVMPPPPPPSVSFAADVQPIFTANCALGGCHGDQGTQLGLELTAGTAYDRIVNVPSVQLSTMDRIEPREPERSYLVHKLQGTHLNVGGLGEQMPRDAAALPQASIDRIRTWVAEGARNN